MTFFKAYSVFADLPEEIKKEGHQVLVPDNNNELKFIGRAKSRRQAQRLVRAAARLERGNRPRCSALKPPTTIFWRGFASAGSDIQYYQGSWQ